MAITRRQFITRSGLVAGGLLGSGLWGNPFVRKALGDIGNKYFVVLFLDGGNDGLNTVVPAGNATYNLRDAYQTARNTGSGGLQLSVASLSPYGIGNDPNTGTPLALHPGLSAFKTLFDAGNLGVIQGCGYPEYSLSHDEARTIWETGTPLTVPAYTGSGWVGRYLVEGSSGGGYGGTDIPALNIANRVVGELIQTGTSVLAVRRLSRFGFPHDEYDPTDDAAKDATFQALYGQAGVGAQPLQAYVGNTGSATFDATQNYPGLDPLYENARPSWDAMYGALNTSTARDLREVAKVIYGVETGQTGVLARHFQVSNGGYDTHADQGENDPNGRHYEILAEVANALEVFYNDCADMGIADRLCILVWSEFSRRIRQNDNGTDHGSQGPMFVIGGSGVINGGLYGMHPDIREVPADDTQGQDDEGNTIYRQTPHPVTGIQSVDFRDVYGTVLQEWLGMTQGDILANVLALDAGQDPDFYWTTANFNTGQLANLFK